MLFGCIWVALYIEELERILDLNAKIKFIKLFNKREKEGERRRTLGARASWSVFTSYGRLAGRLWPRLLVGRAGWLASVLLILSSLLRLPLGPGQFLIFVLMKIFQDFWRMSIYESIRWGSFHWSRMEVGGLMNEFGWMNVHFIHHSSSKKAWGFNRKDDDNTPLYVYLDLLVVAVHMSWYWDSFGNCNAWILP